MKTKEIIVFAALLLFALLPNILIVCLASDVSSFGDRLLYIFTTLALYGAGLCIFHRRAYLYMISLGFAFSIFEMFHLFLRGSTTSMLYLYMWFKTPPEVLWSMVMHYFWIIPTTLILWVGFYVVAHYFVERKHIAPLRWRLPIFAALVAIFYISPMHVCPTSFLSQLQSLAAFAIHVERTLPEQRNYSYDISPNKSKADETMIIILGETSYAQWQELDYQDSLAIHFDSVYTTCPVSGVAVPLLFSRATPTDPLPFFVEKGFIRAFNEAGYYSAWLSNYGYHDHFLMRIADDCSYLSYLPFQPDTALLTPFREAMSQPLQRHLIVMATQGGRDSISFAQTPYLLRQLTDSLRVTHQPAVLVYIGSDNIHLTDNYSELHVPMMIWTNPNYRYRHRPLLRQLQAHRTQRFSTDGIFHSVLHLAQIDCPLIDSTKAIGCEKFEAAEKIYYLDENLCLKYLP